EPEIRAAQEEWERPLLPTSAEDLFRRRWMATMPEFEKLLRLLGPSNWAPSRGLRAHYPLDGEPTDRTGQSPGGVFVDGLPAFAAGRLEHAAVFDGQRFLDAGDVGHFGFYDKFSFAAWVYPEGAAGGTLLSRMVDVPRGAGYQLALAGGKVQLNLVVRW